LPKFILGFQAYSELLATMALPDHEPVSDLNSELFAMAFEAGVNEPVRFLNNEFFPEMEWEKPIDALRFSVRVSKSELPRPIRLLNDLKRALVSLTVENMPRDPLSISAMPLC